jgi:hypothetical protein
MPLEDLLEKPLPKIPADIAGTLQDPTLITLTAFEDKNRILTDERLHMETGYRKFPGKQGYLVSMYCPMPGVTADMIAWWFWWHPREDLRYQVWFPGEHFSNRYPKREAPYFERDTMPEFQPNTQLPTERISGMRMPLRIDFVEPRTFGFSPDAMERAGFPIIVCGHVGLLNGLVWHTEMAHMLKQTDDGLLLVSRFWLGRTLHNPLLRKFVLTDQTARGMAEHCCVEYRNLAQILPGLYHEYR